MLRYLIALALVMSLGMASDYVRTPESVGLDHFVDYEGATIRFISPDEIIINGMEPERAVLANVQYDLTWQEAQKKTMELNDWVQGQPVDIYISGYQYELQFGKPVTIPVVHVWYDNVLVNEKV